MASAVDPTVTITSCNNTSANDHVCYNDKLYRGVRKRKWGKWVSEIRLPNSRERIWLGSYDTEEKAARAFDAALYCLRGPHAAFNFPDTPGALHAHVGDHYYSLSPPEIREVAAKFANNTTVLQIQQEEREPSSQQQHGGDDSFESSNTCSIAAESSSSSSSNLWPFFDGPVQVGHEDLRNLDWTFSDMLDDMNNGLNIVGNDFGLYYDGPDHEMEYSGDLCSIQHPTLFEEEMEGAGDAFTNHSFLWSWNF